MTLVSLLEHVLLKMLYKFGKTQVNIVFSLITFFSSYQLSLDLNKQYFRATRTMRKDRVMKCLLTDLKEMKRKEQGTYDYRIDEKIEIV